MNEREQPGELRKRQPFQRIIVNLTLGAGAFMFVAVLAEPVLRLRYAEPARPTPPVVYEVMPLLQPDPRVGFTWQPNIGADREIVFNNADIVYEPLTTDEFGVWNAPEAIARRAAGDRVQVLGLGDSFMEMAAPGFHRTFSKRGMFYYSLAIHRQAPPHYVRWLEDYGADMKPEAIVLGLFENDFLETEDFDAWAGSGMDWFTYHSGTWFGPAAAADPLRRFAHTWLRGYTGLANVLRMRLRGERMSVAGPSDRQISRVTEDLTRAAVLARGHGIHFWLLLIPSKPSARGEATPESAAFDRVVAEMGTPIAGIIDLRPIFRAHPDPSSLYYRDDGHWNDAGIVLAAETVMEHLSAAAPAAESTVVSDESGSH